MQLIDILNAANKRYPGTMLEDYFKAWGGKLPEVDPDLLLAKFVLARLSKSFNAKQSGQEQALQALLAMQQARDALQGAIDGLDEMYEKMRRTAPPVRAGIAPAPIAM